ncbi:MAG: AAA family ATPase [Thermofilaceae archaeon]
MNVQLSANIQALILGKQGSGKSLLARCALAMEVVQDTRDFYVSISTKPDHYYVHAPARGPNLEISLEKLGFAHVPLSPETIPDAAKFRLSPFFEHSSRLCLTIMGLSPEARKDVMNAIARDILETQSAVVLIDEADRLIPPQGKFVPDEFLNLIRQGRYKGINMWFISHSDTSIHHEVVEEANLIVAFCMLHPTRVERLRHVFTDPRMLTRLRRWEYLAHYQVSGEEWIGNSTYDLFQLWKIYPPAFVDSDGVYEYFAQTLKV